ncbi:MAG: type I DNA topoisomerase [Clostridia bacterium]|nr:type I DNA topoisomerase [Clostridia bacterium]
MANLVIVESPAKANTIKAYLGSNYKVIASKGHVRDLPKSTLGIDVDHGFEPHYINIRGKGDVIRELRREAKLAKKIFLATDPDREGEAISWHIATELGIDEDKECRITFNETTKDAVKEAIKNPRKINRDLVNSQQARRILDRIVGFSLSEVLWKKVKSGLSAGRVQSVATRIITEREEEIRAFIPQEYWTFDATLKTEGGEELTARLYGNANGKIKISSAKEAELIESALKSGSFKVASVKHAEKHRMPAPPFTTSTLQQEAAKKLGFQTQKTMKIAQELYEGLNLGPSYGGFTGLITYMRTDSQRISPVAQSAAAEFIKRNWGEEFLPKNPRNYKSNSNAQDAHEAIRPANIFIQPAYVRKSLTNDQYKLYKLIWERFIASQMLSAVLDTVSIEIENSGYIFRLGGYTVKTRGYMAVYDNTVDEDEEEMRLGALPKVKKNENLATKAISKQQRFTEPPQRFTEASLVKFLEENGIGRPSTYATIISTIIAREYIKRDGKQLVATELGEVTTKFMRENFPNIVDYEFTAFMESRLDSIEHKKNSMEGVLSDFYGPFVKDIEAASKNGKSYHVVPVLEESDVICDKCGARMVYKSGKFGKFLACPSYPACKNTKAVDKNGKVVEKVQPKIEYAGSKCEACGGEMVVRRGRFGIFYACENYPTCTFTKQKTTELEAKCPICSSKILARHGKSNSLFYSCEKYPECDFSSWDMPLLEKCPDCSEMLYYRKSRKSVICKKEGCGYKRAEEMTVVE